MSVLLAVSTALGTTLGALVMFVWLNVLVPAYPELGAGAYADGYRSARRIAELEQQVQTLEFIEAYRQIERKVEGMSDEELNKALLKWTR